MTWATIKKILTLTCDESTRLVSESLDRELPAGERWAVRLHALSCRSCRRFRRQLLFLGDAVRRGAGGMEADAQQACPSNGPRQLELGTTLSPEARERIKQALARRNSS